MKDKLDKHLEFAESNRLIRYKAWTDTEDKTLINDKDYGKVAYYHPFGYEYIDAYLNASRIPKGDFKVRLSVAVRLAHNIVFLNPDKPDDLLIEWLDLVCEDKLNTSDFTVSKEVMRDIVKAVRNGDAEVITRTAKYEWLNITPLEVKRKVVARNISSNRRLKSMLYIERSLEWLFESDIFVTSTQIAKASNELFDDDGLSVSTVKRLINDDIRSEINAHNESTYNTSSFKMYEKFCTVHKIKEAIKAIKHINSTLTKAAIAKEASVHRNTVHNLWEEEEIQEVLNNYNKAIITS